MGEAKRKKQQYNKEFKIQAVKMITEGGHKASEVARSLGIHPNMLYSWKSKYAKSGEKAFVGTGQLTELAELRRKLKEVEMERDILKKAVGIFSKETDSDSDL